MSASPLTDRRSPRVLIVRLSAIGDVIQTLPVLSALRGRFPDAFLAWVVEQRASDLLQGHEALDELIVVPRGFLKSPRTVLEMRARLRAMKFDVVLETQGLSKSALVAWLSGCRRRIGFRGTWGREISPWLNTELVDGDGVHIVERNLRLLQPLGIDRPEARFHVPQTAADQAEAERILCEIGIAGPFAIINSGAAKSRLWPASRFAAVARHLGTTWNLPTVVVWAGQDEHRRAGEVVASAVEHARLAPATTLRELAAVARRARLFLSSDTGPLHLAAAVGTPCVGLYGPWPADRHGPYGPKNISIQKMYFTGGSRQRRQASSVYMEAIDVPTVCAACDEILGAGSES